MSVDHAFLAQGTLPDVVILGTGPAGITLALQLAERSGATLLLEAGGRAWSASSHDVYPGAVHDDPYVALDQTRLRFFNGSSNTGTDGAARSTRPTSRAVRTLACSAGRSPKPR